GNMHFLIIVILGIIPALISNALVTNTDQSKYGFFGLQVFSTSTSGIISPVINSSEETSNTSLSSSINQTTNASNMTILNSNITNKSSNLNTTMPEQLPPKSLNGSTAGKI